MFKPADNDEGPSAWVPLRRWEWSFKFCAVPQSPLGGDVRWAITDLGTMVHPGFSDEPEHPEWDGVAPTDFGLPGAWGNVDCEDPCE